MNSWKWILKIVFLTSASTVLGWMFPSGVNLLLKTLGQDPIELNLNLRILTAISFFLWSLIIELIFWSRESLDSFAETTKLIMGNELKEVAYSALNESLFRWFEPKKGDDVYNAKLHRRIVENYFLKLDGLHPHLQRAASVLTERHLSNWEEDVRKFTGDGIPLILEDDAMISRRLIEGGKRYLLIERDLFIPRETWSHGYIQFIEWLGTCPGIDKEFILLATEEERLKNQAALDSLRKYMRKQSFKSFFCNELIAKSELEGQRFFEDVFEVFNDDVVLITGRPGPDGTYRNRLLPARIHVLGNSDLIGRFLKVVHSHREKL